MFSEAYGYIMDNWEIHSSRKYFSLFVPVAAPLIEADKETDEQNYLLWRLQKGVAEGSTEIPKGRLLVPPWLYAWTFFHIFLNVMQGAPIFLFI